MANDTPKKALAREHALVSRGQRDKASLSRGATAAIAVIANDIDTLKDQHRQIDERIGALEDRIGELEIADQRLSSDINHHIASEDERWDRNEKQWTHAFRILYVMGAFVGIIAIENIDKIKMFFKFLI